MSSTANPNHFDAKNAASYDTRWAPLAPLRDSLHLQIGLILRPLPAEARILCVGVGTGAEIIALARRFPDWRFLASDPSAPMLDICRQRLAAEGIADRCEFHQAYVQELPTGAAFDAATALLVSHFITQREPRIEFFRGIAARLRPQGLLISADLSRSATGQHERLLLVWQEMMRHAGASEEQVAAMLESYGRSVSILTTAEIEDLLTAAGFGPPVQFAQSLLIHAWFAQRT
ncbi:MAG TPA: class I SAM-dependent methyltransferase [Lacunisphaera sp.]|nr:class I SAM-dependent methyltransferase [Lacunisphaera sp.]